jgi:hypothetical protein
MIDIKIQELIHKKIDGEISSSEAEELARHMANDPQIEIEYNKIQSLSTYFKDVEVTPPIGLKKEVMAAVTPAPQPIGEPESFVTWLKGTLSSWAKPPIVYPFAAGAVMTAAILLLVLGPISSINDLNHNDLSGTLVLGDRHDQFQRVVLETMDIPNGEGRLSVSISEDLTVVNVYLKSDMFIELQLEFDQTKCELIAIEQEKSQARAIHSEGEFVSIGHFGTNEYTIVLKNLTGSSFPLYYRVNASGTNIEEKLTIQAK